MMQDLNITKHYYNTDIMNQTQISISECAALCLIFCFVTRKQKHVAAYKSMAASVSQSSGLSSRLSAEEVVSIQSNLSGRPEQSAATLFLLCFK